jgi:hypothetical protein
MASIQHSALSDPEIHEPKGITTALAGRVYVSDGSASGSWTALQDTYTTVLADVSSASVVYVPIHSTCTVTRVITVLGGAITGADDTITVKNAAGTSMGTITLTQSGSAAGDIDTLSPVANNTVSANSFITVESDGASGTSRQLFITVLTSRTA